MKRHEGKERKVRNTSSCSSSSLVGSGLSRADGKDPPIISPDVCT